MVNYDIFIQFTHSTNTYEHLHNAGNCYRPGDSRKKNPIVEFMDHWRSSFQRIFNDKKEMHYSVMKQNYINNMILILLKKLFTLNKGNG